MKTIVLLGTAIVAGAVRYSVEGPIPVRDDAEADRLIEAGLAIDVDDDDHEDGDDGLDRQKVDELKTIAADEEIDLGNAKTKPDIIAAIRAHRAGAGQ